MLPVLCLLADLVVFFCSSGWVIIVSRMMLIVSRVMLVFEGLNFYCNRPESFFQCLVYCSNCHDLMGKGKRLCCWEVLFNKGNDDGFSSKRVSCGLRDWLFLVSFFGIWLVSC